MKKCPRCKLPPEGVHKCQYCGYDLIKDEKRHHKRIRNRLKDTIGALNKDKMFPTKKLKLRDNGGTRSGTDRRKVFSLIHLPEKRSVGDRRKGLDRRRQVASIRQSERRYSLKHGKPYPRGLKRPVQNVNLI